jgi:hypothetical protein
MITLERLKEILTYDPETGEFKWTGVASRTIHGSVAGYIHNRDGYHLISIKHRKYRSHRLAWLYMTGEWPKNQIDHINGIRNDNRIANLRDVTSSENNHNRKYANSNNKSCGTLGVSYLKNLGMFQSYIKVNGKPFYLGCYDSKELAHEAYLTAKRKMHAGNTL